MKIWMNGRLVNAKNAKISVFDRGFLYGDGVFETMRGYDGKIFKIDEHLSRLFGSAKAINIRIPYSGKNLKAAINKILKANSLTNAYIRVTVTRGEGSFTLTGASKMNPSVVITAKDFTGYPETFYSRGISAAISGIRQDEDSPLNKIKSLNFLAHILARQETQGAGFSEAILLNKKGFVTEAATSNIFLIKNGALLTPSPDSGILPGITRDITIRLAKKLKIRVEERAVSPVELAVADEVFLTNSMTEILPVVKIGRFRIGSGKPGEVTKLLHEAYCGVRGSTPGVNPRG